MFVLLAFLLARRPVVAVAGGPSDEDTETPAKAASKTISPSGATQAPAPYSGKLAEVDAAVGTSLDGLKDTLFARCRQMDDFEAKL